MSKVYSNYLNQEIELLTVEKLENGKSLNIIMHDSLCDVIHNQIPAEKGITYNYTPVITTETHSVMICTIGDKAGRRIQEIGEATTSSLDTDIAKMYPALTASQRAFDRAVIKYLNLPGKVFSNTEIPVSIADPVMMEETKAAVIEGAKSQKTPEQKKTGIASAPVEEKKEDDIAKATIVIEEDAKNAATPLDEEIIMDQAPENTSEETSETTAVEEKPATVEDDITVTIGKYSKQPILLSDLIKKAETDPKEKSWLVYIVGNVHSKEPEKAKQLEAIKEYLNSLN